MFVSSKKFIFEPLTPGVAVFGDEVPKEIIKIKWDHEGEALI